MKKSFLASLAGAVAMLIIPTSLAVLPQVAYADSGQVVPTISSSNGGYVLSATTGLSHTAKSSLQWYRCDKKDAATVGLFTNDMNCQKISGATKTTYLVVAEDAGKYLSLVVKVTSPKHYALAISSSKPAPAPNVPSSPRIVSVEPSAAVGGKVNLNVNISLPTSNGGSPITQTLVTSNAGSCKISGTRTSCTLKSVPSTKEVALSAKSENKLGLGRSSTSIKYSPAVLPTFGVSNVVGTFTVQISNFDPNFTYAGSATEGGLVTVSSTGLVTVTGVEGGTSLTVSITSTRSGYVSGQQSLTAVTATCAEGGICKLGNIGPGGGFIAYVSTDGFDCGAAFTATGSPTGGKCHFLEVAPSNWGLEADGQESLVSKVGPIRYEELPSVPNEVSPDSSSSEIGRGYKNSVELVSATTMRGGDPLQSQAGAARAYTGGSKTDWFLPNKSELHLICQWNTGVVQSVEATCSGGSLNSATYGAQSSGFADAPYGTSSFLDFQTVWVHRFDNAKPGLFPTFGGANVRPIRAF